MRARQAGYFCLFPIVENRDNKDSVLDIRLLGWSEREGDLRLWKLWDRTMQDPSTPSLTRCYKKYSWDYADQIENLKCLWQYHRAGVCVRGAVHLCSCPLDAERPHRRTLVKCFSQGSTVLRYIWAKDKMCALMWLGILILDMDLNLCINQHGFMIIKYGRRKSTSLCPGTTSWWPPPSPSILFIIFRV